MLGGVCNWCRSETISRHTPAVQGLHPDMRVSTPTWQWYQAEFGADPCVCERPCRANPLPPLVDAATRPSGGSENASVMFEATFAAAAGLQGL